MSTENDKSTTATRLARLDKGSPTEKQALDQVRWEQSATPGLQPLIERIRHDLDLLDLMATEPSRPQGSEVAR